VKFVEEELIGRKCYGGLDLAKNRDITGLVLLFPPVGEEKDFKILCRFWCPKKNAEERSRKDKVDYLQWANDGYLSLTPGNVTDFKYIEKDIVDLARDYQIVSIGYDPWNATYLATNLISQGAPMREFRQTVTNFNEPCGFLEKLAIEGYLSHNMNPVLRWMNGNVALYKNREGLIKIDKRESTEKVDGMVALAEAIGEYLHFEGQQEEENIFNDEGMIFF